MQPTNNGWMINDDNIPPTTSALISTIHDDSFSFAFIFFLFSKHFYANVLRFPLDGIHSLFYCGEILPILLERISMECIFFPPDIRRFLNSASQQKNLNGIIFFLLEVLVTLWSPGNDAPPPVRLDSFIFASSWHCFGNYSNSPALPNDRRARKISVPISNCENFFEFRVFFSRGTCICGVVVRCHSHCMYVNRNTNITRLTMNLHDKLHQNKLLYRKNGFRNERQKDERETENRTFIFFCFVLGCRRMIVLKWRRTQKMKFHILCITASQCVSAEKNHNFVTRKCEKSKPGKVECIANMRISVW